MEALKTYLKEIRNIPLLTSKEEIQLSRKVRKGDVLISGSNFATTKDNWFSSNTIEIVKDANFEADYKIIEDTYSQKSFIPSIYINIK